MAEIDYVAKVREIIGTNKKIIAKSGYVATWENWFKGKVPSFHNYTIFNGDKKQRMTKLSLKMAKQVAQDWASLLMNEKVNVVVKDKEKMDKLLMGLDFWTKGNETVELGFGLSLSALVAELDGLVVDVDEKTGLGTINLAKSNPVLMLNRYSVKKIVPLTWKNGECTECAFVQENTDNTVVVIHQLNEEGNYVITWCDYDNQEEKLNKTYSLDTRSKNAWFMLEYPRLINNLEPDSKMPICIFANAVDTLMAIDNAFDSYNNEFLLGRKRTYVSAELNEIDKTTGEEITRFDPQDNVIYRLPKSISATGENKALIQTSNDELRVDAHSRAIQDLINFLSKQCDLGVDYYRFEKGRVMTATQVISEKSDTFRNLKKHEIVLEKGLVRLIKGIMYIYNTFIEQNYFSDIENVEIKFDDSIIEDKNTEKTNDQKDVELGVMSKTDYRAKWYGEKEDDAKNKLKEISGDPDLLARLTHFTPFLTQGTISVEEFVNNVYIDVQNKEALVEQIKEQMKSGAEVFSDADLLNLRTPQTE